MLHSMQSVSCVMRSTNLSSLGVFLVFWDRFHHARSSFANHLFLLLELLDWALVTRLVQQFRHFLHILLRLLQSVDEHDLLLFQ